MITLCLAVISLLLAYGAGLIIGIRHERNEWLSNSAIIFEEKKQPKPNSNKPSPAPMPPIRHIKEGVQPSKT